jgi:hypothetical protein
VALNTFSKKPLLITVQLDPVSNRAIALASLSMSLTLTSLTTLKKIHLGIHTTVSSLQYPSYCPLFNFFYLYQLFEYVDK